MAAEEGQVADAGSSGAVSINDQFDIYVDQPLKQFDSPPALAYVCTEKRDSDRELFALVCDPKQPPRHDLVSVMQQISQKGLVRAVEWGVVDWPLEGRRCPAIIYERPRGDRVLVNVDDEPPRMSEEAISRKFVEPAVAVLREMHNKGITHRAIRLTNLFYDSSPAAQATIMFGECLSAPPAIGQPAVYETIETAMAPPTGRGPGSVSDDLYAFGVTILALLIGQNPCVGMSNEEVIQSKLIYGSYGALVQRHRIPLTMMEVVRGLLMDEIEERWTLDDLEFWLSGRRLSPKQPDRQAKAARAFSFQGRDLLTRRDVAFAFSNNWDAAIEPVRAGMLDTWLRRSLGEEAAIEAVNTAKATISATETETESDDRMLARIIIALDPLRPITYKSFSATIDGIGGEIAAKYLDESTRNHFVEVLRANLIVFSTEMLGKSAWVGFGYIPQFEKMKAFLENTSIGHGIERVIYELNPTLSCQSPLLEAEYVYDLTEMLHAYERLAQQNPGGLAVLIDRHIAAFIVTHLKGGLMAEMREIENLHDPLGVARASIRVLALVQDQTDSIPAPNLCNVAIKILEPAVERFNSRSQRERIRLRLQKVAHDGKLNDILRIVNNTSYIENDRTAYRRAVKEFVRSVLQMQQLTFEKTHKKQLARSIGAEVSAFISCILSLIAIVIIAVVWYMGS
jgi:eukaryotic-like serine/threonine-protein kinase